MPILQAIVDGKTIQHKTINREWYDTNVASLDHLVTYYKDYRIKPETTYRPFKDAEECWAEMLEHQPFGCLADTSVLCKELNRRKDIGDDFFVVATEGK